jgi:RNA polymerase sigma-70 factor, ECF subfamily
VNAKTDIVEHIPRLRRYARALAGDPVSADDLVQDTLERALAKYERWRPDSDLRAWLFTLMHNVFINQVRAFRARSALNLDATQELHVPGSQMDIPRIHDIRAALRQMPSNQREVLLLVGLEQFSYEETARLLGVPLGTVMSRLSRAREKMRQFLAEDSVTRLKVVK